MCITKKPIALAVACIPAINVTAHPLRAGVDTESELLQERGKSRSSLLGISLNAPKKIKDFDEFIVKITLTNYGNEDVQILRTPDTGVLYDRNDFTEVDSQGLANSLEWIDWWDGVPRFLGGYDLDCEKNLNIAKFMNPMRKVVKGELTGDSDSDANGDSKDDDVGSKVKTEGFGFERDTAEREKKLITLREKGLKLSSSSSKTLIYRAKEAYISYSNVAKYRFQLKPQKFSYTKDGGKTILYTEVTLEEEFTVELRGILEQ